MARCNSNISLALAGGGPEGAVYEIGALRAIEEAFEGIDLNELYMYLGISAGAFIGSCLANDMTSAQLCRSVVTREPGEHPFVPENFFTPAVGAFMRGGMKLPRLLMKAVWSYLSNLEERRFLESFTSLAQALPVGIFHNEPIRKFLHKSFSRSGRSDDFRELRHKLEVVATDLDSGQAVCFGSPGWDHIPISKAVQASTALPGMYPPVEIEGRHFVDGVLLKTLHASVAFDEGSDLVICVNPIVPVDTIHSIEAGVMRRGKLINRGLPTVLSQTLRTIVHSRMVMGLEAYQSRYADRDLLIFEPPRDDYRMFFTNVFSFAKRKEICEHAYNSTRRRLLEEQERLIPFLARHGITLRLDVLEEERNLWQAVGLGERRRRQAPLTRRLDRALLNVESLINRMAEQEEEPALVAGITEAAPIEPASLEQANVEATTLEATTLEATTLEITTLEITADPL